MSSPITLHAPVHPTQPTAIRVARVVFNGSAQVGDGHVWLPTPSNWPRASENGATVATYGRIPIDVTCGAYLQARPALSAVKDVGAYLARIGGPDYTVRAGRYFRVRASAAEPVLRATAVGVLRVARNRYAGARIDVTFDPECAPEAVGARPLVDGLVHAVRGITADLRVAALARH
jgi:hypothetical protein